MTDSTRLAQRALAPITPSASTTAKAKSAEEELGFDTLVDAVNPLQHLPGVSSVYREASGDSIGLPARLIGGFLFGGPMGLLGSAALAAFEEVTGDSPLGHLVSLVEGTGSRQGSTQVADAATTANPYPWMKPPEGTGTAAANALPSRASLDAALARLTPETEAPAVAAKPSKPLQAPETLAKLYELQATQPRDQQSIKL